MNFQPLFNALDEPNPEKKKFSFLGLVLGACVFTFVGGWAGREMMQSYLNSAQAKAVENAKIEYRALADTVALKSQSRDKEISDIRKQRDEDVQRTENQVKRLEDKMGKVEQAMSDLKDTIIERLPPKPTRKASLDLDNLPEREKNPIRSSL